MKSLVIIQARMGSSRLPGKSLMPIGNRPMLDYLVEAILKKFPHKDVILATSEASENQVLRKYASEKGIACFSGDEINVASRYESILKLYPGYDYFFRICGDTPYYGTETMQKGLEIVKNEGAEIVSSMPNKGYPMGCNLELFRCATFLESCPQFKTLGQKEHVTSYFYENLQLFKHKLIACTLPEYTYEQYKFSVDTSEDLRLAERMLEKMNYCPWDYSIEEKMKLQETLLKQDKNK